MLQIIRQPWIAVAVCLAFFFPAMSWGQQIGPVTVVQWDHEIAYLHWAEDENSSVIKIPQTPTATIKRSGPTDFHVQETTVPSDGVEIDQLSLEFVGDVFLGNQLHNYVRVRNDTIASMHGTSKDSVAVAVLDSEVTTLQKFYINDGFRLTGNLSVQWQAQDMFTNVFGAPEFGHRQQVTVDSPSLTDPTTFELPAPTMPFVVNSWISPRHELPIDADFSGLTSAEVDVRAFTKTRILSDGWGVWPKPEIPMTAATNMQVHLNFIHPMYGITKQQPVQPIVAPIWDPRNVIDALFDESAGNGGSDGISPLPSGPSIAQYPYLPTDLWYALPELEKELDVTMLSDARFNGILDADGLNQTLEVWVDGAMIATLENGGAVDFVDLLGEGASAFSLRVPNSTILPTNGDEGSMRPLLQLGFDQSVGYFSAVPEPSSGCLLITAFVGVAWLLRSRRRSGAAP